MVENITADELRRLIRYEPETGEFTWLVSKQGQARDKSAGFWQTGTAGKTYRKIKISYQAYFAHRLAWLWMTGAWPNGEIDHKDGNGRNNRWENLREGFPNMRNRRLNENNTSGQVGVDWSKRLAKWRARINAGGKRIEIGHFTNKADAISARKKAEREHGYDAKHGSARPL